MSEKTIESFHRRRFNPRGSLIILLALVILAAGCSDDDETTTQPEAWSSALPPTSSQATLMDNYVAIYQDMLPRELEYLLHPDYRTVVQAATIQDWAASENPVTSGFFDRSTEIQIHENIFGGRMGLHPSGQEVPPVVGISVEAMTGLGSWAAISPEDEDFGDHEGYQRAYALLIILLTPDQFMFRVQQNVHFYVAPVEEEGQQVWKLLGTRGYDPGKVGGKASERFTLDSIKALYRGHGDS